MNKSWQVGSYIRRAAAMATMAQLFHVYQVTMKQQLRSRLLLLLPPPLLLHALTLFPCLQFIIYLGLAHLSNLFNKHWKIRGKRDHAIIMKLKSCAHG
jgi:hypothetical protein